MLVTLLPDRDIGQAGAAIKRTSMHVSYSRCW